MTVGRTAGQGRCAGLVLAEVELGPDEEPLAGLGFPAVEVSDDDRFSGGALARATEAQLRDLFASWRGRLP